MKSKDKKELFTRNEKELRKALKEARGLLLNLVLDNKQNKIKNTRQIFWKKKEIALILTALREKELINGRSTGSGHNE
jgi:ribosomal protein L29